MSKTAVVDTDDLETLLFATGTIKQIEDALQQRKSDILVNRALPRLSAAHDNLSKAWRNATREPHPSWNEPLTYLEISLIDDIWPKPEYEGDLRFLEIRMPTKTGFMERLRTLRNKDMVELGTLVSVMAWGDSGTKKEGIPELWVRLTPRGIDAYLAKTRSTC